MNLREVTIGRSKDCDIYLDERCQYASHHHGTLYYDGNQLMFRDTSTNGTLVNNINVHKRAVPVHRGDIIMIAGKYPITWSQIDAFFPYSPMQQSVIPDTPSAPSSSQSPTNNTPNLSAWSWGAFALSWIWGFFNGCWWMFLVNLGLWILSAFTAWVPGLWILLSIVSLSVSIYFGCNGTKWAWENRVWSSTESFLSTQKTWNTVGLILFILGIVSCVLTVVFVGVAIAGL